MNRIPLIWMLAGVTGLLTLPTDRQEAQFRTLTTGVSHHVVVRRDGRAVRDLAPHDFLLTDSGVAQQVTVIDAADVPLDISLVSDGVRYGTNTTFDREMDTVADLAKPGDRVRVVLNDYAQREQSVGPGHELLEAAARSKTCFPVYDALARVLMRPTDASRDHVVILLTLSQGSGSVLSGAQVIEVAKRSNARLYVVTGLEVDGLSSAMEWVADMRCARLDRDLSGDGKTRLRPIEAMPSLAEQHRALVLLNVSRLLQIATVTGGGEVRPAGWSRSITEPVRKALEDARSGYFLRYTATNVPETGWHPITVKINRPGKFDIQVRPGYQR